MKKVSSKEILQVKYKNIRLILWLTILYGCFICLIVGVISFFEQYIQMIFVPIIVTLLICIQKHVCKVFGYLHVDKKISGLKRTNIRPEVPEIHDWNGTITINNSSGYDSEVYSIKIEKAVHLKGNLLTFNKLEWYDIQIGSKKSININIPFTCELHRNVCSSSYLLKVVINYSFGGIKNRTDLFHCILIMN